MESLFEEVNIEKYKEIPNPSFINQKNLKTWIWDESGIKAFEQKNVPSYKGEGVLLFPYSLKVVDHKDRHIATVACEQIDYRELAYLTKQPITELKGDSKGYLSPITIVLFMADEKMELEVYNGNLIDQEVFPHLAEIVSDQFDLFEESVRQVEQVPTK
ncbi:MAG: hypothetical protein ACOXZZ_01115 [Sphaerochaetaceae bacterium]|jgi:hypothetical protein